MTLLNPTHNHAAIECKAQIRPYSIPTVEERVRASERFDKMVLVTAHLAALHDAYILEMATHPVIEVSAKPLSPTSGVVGLKPSTLKQLKIGKVHRRRVLHGTLCVKTLSCKGLNGLSYVVNVFEDEEGMATPIYLSNAMDANCGSAQAQRFYPQGSKVAVKEPYLTRLPDGEVILSVEKPTDLVLLWVPDIREDNSNTRDSDKKNQQEVEDSREETPPPGKETISLSFARDMKNAHIWIKCDTNVVCDEKDYAEKSSVSTLEHKGSAVKQEGKCHTNVVCDEKDYAKFSVTTLEHKMSAVGKEGKCNSDNARSTVVVKRVCARRLLVHGGGNAAMKDGEEKHVVSENESSHAALKEEEEKHVVSENESIHSALRKEEEKYVVSGSPTEEKHVVSENAKNECSQEPRKEEERDAVSGGNAAMDVSSQVKWRNREGRQNSQDINEVADRSLCTQEGSAMEEIAQSRWGGDVKEAAGSSICREKGSIMEEVAECRCWDDAKEVADGSLCAKDASVMEDIDRSRWDDVKGVSADAALMTANERQSTGREEGCDGRSRGLEELEQAALEEAKEAEVMVSEEEEAAEAEAAGEGGMLPGGGFVGGDAWTAAGLRLQGNAHFRKGEFLRAAELYTRAEERARAEAEREEEAVALSNRAEARLRLGRAHLHAALDDADAALALLRGLQVAWAPLSLAKALFRRGRALMGLRRFKEALVSFQLAASAAAPLKPHHHHQHPDRLLADVTAKCRYRLQYAPKLSKRRRAKHHKKGRQPI